MKTLEIIDFERKGNVVRFYLGENGKQWGDDWNDAPYEHNAERVYQEFVKDVSDQLYDYDVEVFEPCDGTINSNWSKEDMIKRKVPCLVIVPKELHDDNVWHDFNSALALEGSHKIYFGDTLDEDS